jgi:hypothetical protein
MTQTREDTITLGTTGNYEERMARKREREASMPATVDSVKTPTGTKIDFYWRKPDDPVLADTLVIFKLTNGNIVTGAILYPEKIPAFHNIVTGKQVPTKDWTPIEGWFPLDELPD